MPIPLLFEAARVAISIQDKRNFLLGCVGVRKDSAIIKSANGSVISSSFSDYRIISDAHAEARTIRKLGKRGTLYVSRVLKLDGSLAMARPCLQCRLRIKFARVEKVFYSIDSYHYGVFDVATEKDRIVEISDEHARVRFGSFGMQNKQVRQQELCHQLQIIA